MRLLPLLLLLSGAALAQGAYRPAPPAFNPTTDSPITTGQPGYVPEPHLVPQPNPRPKRVLPPTVETGIWAGDEPRASVDPVPAILGIPLPVAKPGEKDETATVCASVVTGLLNDAATYAPLQRPDVAARACIAMRLYASCSSAWHEIFAKKHEALTFVDRDRLRLIGEAKDRAKAAARSACDGVTIPPEAEITRMFIDAALRRGLDAQLRKEAAR